MALLLDLGTITYDGKTIPNFWVNNDRFYQEIKTKISLQDYTIQNAPKPQKLAEILYGREDYYWILLVINQITDPYYGWIKSNYELEVITKKKYKHYGELYAIHHHNDPNTGQDYYDFVEFPENSGDYYDVNDTNHENIQFKDLLIPVTNLEHERNLNEKLRVIKIVPTDNITNFIDLFETASRTTNIV